jgi:hypothetical protein
MQLACDASHTVRVSVTTHICCAAYRHRFLVLLDTSTVDTTIASHILLPAGHTPFLCGTWLPAGMALTL